MASPWQRAVADPHPLSPTQQPSLRNRSDRAAESGLDQGERGVSAASVIESSRGGTVRRAVVEQPIPKADPLAATGATTGTPLQRHGFADAWRLSVAQVNTMWPSGQAPW